jgi:carbon storage regulator
MLVLTRKLNERVMIGQGIEVVVLAIHENRVKLGFVAPGDVPVDREEVLRRREQDLIIQDSLSLHPLQEEVQNTD